MRKEYNSLIIGAGQIGAGYDDKQSLNILTHAHAYLVHPGFNLVGFVDTDSQKVRDAADKWDCDYFASISEAFEKHRIDVVSVAVSDENHYNVLMELLNYSFLFVFCEKPIAANVLEAEEIIDKYKNKNIDIAINYSRRFVPEIELIKKENTSKRYGEFISGSGFYGKGIMHNGSHMIDLLHYLIGDIVNTFPIDSFCDYFPTDPSVSALLTFANKQHFYLKAIDCALFTIFEIDLLFDRSRLRIINSGFNIEKYHIEESSVFRGYKQLVRKDEITTTFGKSIYYAIDNIFQFLNNGDPIKCSAVDGLKAMKICSQLRK